MMCTLSHSGWRGWSDSEPNPPHPHPHLLFSASCGLEKAEDAWDPKWRSYNSVHEAHGCAVILKHFVDIKLVSRIPKLYPGGLDMANFVPCFQ